MTLELPTYDDVERASHVLKGLAHRTPVMTSETIDRRLGARLFFKCENFQRIGAFKFRGGYNAIASLTADQRKAGVVAFSSGNHAQAVALAARMLDVSATIVMPSDAPASKLAATKGYGAQIMLYDRRHEDREQIAQGLVQREGRTLIPPFNHRAVIAGQGTAVKELIEDVGPLDALYVCLGGGGLLSGSLLAANALSPDCKVYGVEPQAADDARQSLRAGHIVRIDSPASIADGALTNSLGTLTFAIIQRYVADILAVNDDALIETMRFFAERMKIVVEPTGCLGAAAAFGRAGLLAGKRIGVVVSGGNVDLAAYGAWLGAGQRLQTKTDAFGNLDAVG